MVDVFILFVHPSRHNWNDNWDHLCSYFHFMENLGVWAIWDVIKFSEHDLSHFIRFGCLSHMQATNA